eukprot:401527-Pleurochrysis_carterae.AAC.3
MRAKSATSKLPVSFWWYHLKSSTDVAALPPSRANPKECVVPIHGKGPQDYLSLAEFARDVHPCLQQGSL